MDGPADDAMLAWERLVQEARKGDPRQALETLSRARTDVQSDDVSAAVFLLTHEVDLACVIGEPKQAARCLKQAWALARHCLRGKRALPPLVLLGVSRVALACGRHGVALACARAVRETELASTEPQRLEWLYLARLAEIDVLRYQKKPSVEQHLTDLIDFAIAVFGRSHPGTFSAEEALAHFYLEQGRYSDAYPILCGLSWRKMSRTAEPLSRAHTSLDLAHCIDKLGTFSDALAGYELAYRAYESCVGPADPHTVLARGNAAEVARVRRDFRTAERLFVRALRDEVNARGERSSTVAFLRNNLGEVYLEWGRLDEADVLISQACELRKELFGERSSQYVRSLEAAGNVALARGDSTRALAIFDEASIILTEIGGADAARECGLLKGRCFARQGDYLQAVTALREGLAAFRGERHSAPLPRWQARVLLAWCLARSGAWDEALRDLEQTFADLDLELIGLRGNTTRRNHRDLLTFIRRHHAVWLALLLDAPRCDAQNVAAAYRHLQQFKGMETRLHRLQKPDTHLPEYITRGPRDAARDEIDVGEMIQHLQLARREWTQTQLAAWSQPHSAEAAAHVDELREAVEQAEKVYSNLVDPGMAEWEVRGISHLFRRLGGADVMAEIHGSVPGSLVMPLDDRPADPTALLEYVLVDTPAEMPFETTYVVFVVLGDGHIHLRRVGAVNDVAYHVNEFRTNLIFPSSTPSQSSPPWRKGKYLFKKALGCVTDLLEGVRRLLIAPDGILATLPFETLPVEGNELVFDRWMVSYLWYGSELGRSSVLLLNDDSQWCQPGLPVVVAAPDFATAQAGDAATGFPELPFAREEGRSIAEKLQAPLLSDQAVVKTAVTEAHAPEVLHFATHSFNIPAETMPLDQTAPPLVRARATLEDPMERSGIALSGANGDLWSTPGSRFDDGLLFGSEIVDLDLRCTDLVTLSSCESGLGVVSPGDGVQGLRRAFKAAGCRSVVASLWKVPDQAARDLMIDFYSRLLEGQSRAEALHAAKQTVRAAHPYDPLYWAGFILDGETGPLWRFRAAGHMRKVSFPQSIMAGALIGYDLAEAANYAGARRWKKALTLLDRIVESETAPDEWKARALLQRAETKHAAGRLRAALQDYNAFLRLGGHAPDVELWSLYKRGTTRAKIGDLPGAELDLTAVLARPQCSREQRAYALLSRGQVSMQQGQDRKAIADFSAFLATKRRGDEWRARAFLNRAGCHERCRQYGRASKDFASALALLPVSSSARAAAFHGRIKCLLFTGRIIEVVNSLSRWANELRPRSPESTLRILDALHADIDAQRFGQAMDKAVEVWVQLSSSATEGRGAESQS